MLAAYVLRQAAAAERTEEKETAPKAVEFAGLYGPLVGKNKNADGRRSSKSAKSRPPSRRAGKLDEEPAPVMPGGKASPSPSAPTPSQSPNPAVRRRLRRREAAAEAAGTDLRTSSPSSPPRKLPHDVQDSNLLSDLFPVPLSPDTAETSVSSSSSSSSSLSLSNGSGSQSTLRHDNKQKSKCQSPTTGIEGWDTFFTDGLVIGADKLQVGGKNDDGTATTVTNTATEMTPSDSRDIAALRDDPSFVSFRQLQLREVEQCDVSIEKNMTTMMSKWMQYLQDSDSTEFDTKELSYIQEALYDHKTRVQRRQANTAMWVAVKEAQRGGSTSHATANNKGNSKDNNQETTLLPPLPFQEPIPEVRQLSNHSTNSKTSRSKDSKSQQQETQESQEEGPTRSYLELGKTEEKESLLKDNSSRSNDER